MILPDEIVLLIIKNAEVINLELIQKRGYFLDKILNLGLDYYPHYYGPYSPKLKNALLQAKALGFVKVEIEGHKYNYRLTDAGEKIVEFVAEKSPKETREIKEILNRLKKAGDNGDHTILSIAAKIHHILSQTSQEIDLNKAYSIANRLDWDITQEQIKYAIAFLKRFKSR